MGSHRRSRKLWLVKLIDYTTTRFLKEIEQNVNTYNICRSYNDVLRYYMKSEYSTLKGLNDSPYHSRDGEMNVDFITYKYVSLLPTLNFKFRNYSNK